MMTARRLSLDDIDHILLLLSIMGCECMGERWRRRQDGNEHRAKSHHDHNHNVCMVVISKKAEVHQLLQTSNQSPFFTTLSKSIGTFYKSLKPLLLGRLFSILPIVELTLTT